MEEWHPPGHFGSIEASNISLPMLASFTFRPPNAVSPNILISLSKYSVVNLDA